MKPEEVISKVLPQIVPTEEERASVRSLMVELEEFAGETAGELGFEVRPYFVGSTAKDTYLAGDHDFDLFLAFPLDTPLEELREKGLELGKAIGDKLGGYEVAYAEHPYVRARYGGVNVDLVPCYDVRDWRDVRTAVDRSILHTRWVNENLRGRNDEVRLLKRFLKGIRAYGSEIYVRGFSGYLAEILVIVYGSFLNVIKNANFTLKRKVIDPAGWLKRKPEVAMKTVRREVEGDKPLIVIDPVDPRRNVAANLSWEKYGRFYFKSLEFVERPSTEFFFPRERKRRDYLAELRRKGTHLVTLIFERPELVDDLLFPQLERSARGIQKALSRENFGVLGWETGYSGDRAFIMLELDRVERPRVVVQRGPEFFTERALDFCRRHDRVWIEGKWLHAERVVAEDVVGILQELLEGGQVSLGKNLRGRILGSEILVDYVPKEFEQEAYLFLSREKRGLKEKEEQSPPL